MKFGFTPEAEILNARLAMLGFVVAVGTYLTTGQIIPGIWWYFKGGLSTPLFYSSVVSGAGWLPKYDIISFLSIYRPAASKRASRVSILVSASW